MKKFLVFFLILHLQSCQYFDKKVPIESDLLNKQLKEINWKEVDQYPSVVECEKLTDEIQRKQCFFQFITSSITQKLNVDSLSVLFPKLDTLNLNVTVNSNATILFQPLFPKDSVGINRIKIDSILKVKLINLPQVNPAIKRGIPVKTQFILPIIINSK